MSTFSLDVMGFIGEGGALAVDPGDKVALRLAMLIEGECSRQPIEQVARKYGLSRPRYFQLRRQFLQKGALGLANEKRGPKTNYRRKDEVVCQAIRHRFLDPEASSAVIAQKLRQTGFTISKRSVDRIFADFGLQKKTLSTTPGS